MVLHKYFYNTSLAWKIHLLQIWDVKFCCWFWWGYLFVCLTSINFTFISLFSFFQETLQGQEAEKVSQSNKLLKKNWTAKTGRKEKKPQHPNQNQTKSHFFYHSSFNPPVSLSTHSFTFPTIRTKSHPIFLYGSTRFLFYSTIAAQVLISWGERSFQNSPKTIKWL